MNITWIDSELPLKKLKDYKRNPRRINKEQFEKLVRSIKEDGYHNRIKVNLDNTIIGGHQRKKALLAAGLNADSIIKVQLPDRLLQESEIKRINIRDNVMNGEWDMDILSSDFDVTDLIEWGLPEEMFPSFEEIEEKDQKGLNFMGRYVVEIDATDESHQEEIYNEMIQRGLKCKVLTL